MGNLSNLYISQSYISLLHLGSDNTASSTPTEIQDGLGNGIGITVNTSGDLFVGNQLTVGRAVTFSGSVKINTQYTSSTPTYVNSGNQFTDNIIRITGSYASGSQENPTLYEVQAGWPVYGPGLVSGAVVTNATFIPATGWQFTINQNTAVWFGNYYFTNPTPQYINFAVSGSEDITGSLWVRDNFSVTNISASGNISASNLWVKDTIHAYKLDVTIESSSIIFTSGSNIIGDEANVDTQTLIGRVIVSGSLEVTGSTRINGNTTITGSTTISGSITASGNISSSTLSGVGNVTLYSTSVDSRLDVVEATASLYVPFSTSVDSRLDLVEATASYLNTTFSTSVDLRLDNLENFSSSLVTNFATVAQLNASSSTLQSNINTKLDSASFNSYTSSLSSSTSLTSASFNTRINTIATTYATTGSNSFVGNQTITGSLIISSSAAVELTVIGNSTFSGSVRGQVFPITITSNTASMDCSLGNFFTLSLPATSTQIVATNINPGETLSLRILNLTSASVITSGSSVKFPNGFAYIPTNISASTDIITFLSFDSSSIYAVGANYFI